MRFPKGSKRLEDRGKRNTLLLSPRGFKRSHDGVWQTTADEIAEHYIANYYDQAVAHAEQFNK